MYLNILWELFFVDNNNTYCSRIDLDIAHCRLQTRITKTDNEIAFLP